MQGRGLTISRIIIIRSLFAEFTASCNVLSVNTPALRRSAPRSPRLTDRPSLAAHAIQRRTHYG